MREGVGESEGWGCGQRKRGEGTEDGKRGRNRVKEMQNIWKIKNRGRGEENDVDKEKGCGWERNTGQGAKVEKTREEQRA
jgi:hypothetical protein